MQGGTSSLLKAFDFLMRMLHFDFSEWQDVLKAAVESFSVAILATIRSYCEKTCKNLSYVKNGRSGGKS